MYCTDEDFHERKVQFLKVKVLEFECKGHLKCDLGAGSMIICAFVSLVT